MKHTNYKTQFVNTIPPKLEEGVVYMAPHYEVSIHKCMCGCGESIAVLLHEDGWKWTFDGKDVSFSPSIGNFQQPCKSHYFLKNGKVQWC